MDSRGDDRDHNTGQLRRRTTVIWLLTGIVSVSGALYLAKREDEEQIVERALEPVFGNGWIATIVMQLSFLLAIVVVFGLIYGVDRVLFRRKSEREI